MQKKWTGAGVEFLRHRHAGRHESRRMRRHGGLKPGVAVCLRRRRHAIELEGHRLGLSHAGSRPGSSRTRRRRPRRPRRPSRRPSGRLSPPTWRARACPWAIAPSSRGPPIAELRRCELPPPTSPLVAVGRLIDGDACGLPTALVTQFHSISSARDLPPHRPTLPMHCCCVSPYAYCLPAAACAQRPDT